MPTRVVGATDLRKALRKFEPELAKETNKEIRNILKPIVSQARGFMPSNDAVPSGWLKRENAQGTWAKRFYDQSLARKGIVSKIGGSKPNNKGWRSVAAILNKSVGGAIYETAGRKTSGQQGKSSNPNAGKGFISELTQTGQFGSAEAYAGRGRHSRKFAGRAIFRAASLDEGKAVAGVQKALQRAEDKFYGRTR